MFSRRPICRSPTISCMPVAVCSPLARAAPYDLALRDQAYPFGWLSDGRWTNHNNYDLAMLFRYGWQHMDDRQREETARTLQAMVDWSFADTVRPDHRGFRRSPELSSSLGADFYFGASFLVAVDFFSPKPLVWSARAPGFPREVSPACSPMVALSL